MPKVHKNFVVLNVSHCRPTGLKIVLGRVITITNMGQSDFNLRTANFSLKNLNPHHLKLILVVYRGDTKINSAYNFVSKKENSLVH
jgi:hypothetical protein